MQLHQLPPARNKASKRVGRGYGSGRGGHTSSRGSKGTKARSKVGLLFTGTKTKKSLIQRLPKLRGRGKFKTKNIIKITVNLDDITKNHSAKKVTPDSLVKAGLIKLPKSSTHPPEIKIVAGVEKCAKEFTGLTLTNSASDKVIKAGGKVN